MARGSFLVGAPKRSCYHTSGNSTDLAHPNPGLGGWAVWAVWAWITCSFAWKSEEESLRKSSDTSIPRGAPKITVEWTQIVQRQNWPDWADNIKNSCELCVPCASLMLLEGGSSSKPLESSKSTQKVHVHRTSSRGRITQMRHASSFKPPKPIPPKAQHDVRLHPTCGASL